MMMSMIGAVLAVANISAARWVYPGPADNRPTNSVMRFTVNVKDGLQKAEIWWWTERPRGTWLNGKPLTCGILPRFANFPGHVRATGRDFAKELKVGKNVFAFANFKKTNPKFCYGLMIRGELEYADGTRETVWSCADSVKGTGPEEPSGWQDVDFDDSSWPKTCEHGDARKPPWCNYGETERMFCSAEEFGAWIRSISTPLDHLQSESDSPNARVVYSGSLPGIETNGKTIPAISLSCVELAPSANRDTMLRHAADAGMPIATVGISEHAFRCSDRVTYDFSRLDRSIRSILAASPDVRIFFGSLADADGVHDQWLRENPDEAVGYAVEARGRTAPGDYDGNPLVPSFASAAFRVKQATFIAKLGAYCRSQPWGRRILGMHIGYGGSGDGMPWGCHTLPDTGKRMTEAFRRYLKGKYGTEAALRRSWADDRVTFENAAVPDAEARNGSGSYIRDLSDPRDRRLADYYESYQQEFGDWMLSFCKAVKTAFPGALAGTYYGYTILSYNPEGSTACFVRVLASPYVDYMLATTRGYNLTDGLHRHVHSVFHRYGKFTTVEGDVRTHVGYLSGQSEPQWTCRTPAETRSTVSKFVANSFFYGSGFHTVDFGGGGEKWFDCPEALEPVAAGVREWKRLFADPPAAMADVALVFDPDEVWKEGSCKYRRTSRMADHLTTFPMQALNFSGFAYDLYAPTDFVAAKRKYRAVIFLNTFELTGRLEAASRKARKDGATSVWCYAPGLSLSDGFSAEAMRRLTGLDLAFSRELKPLSGVDGPFGERPTVEPADGKFERTFEDGSKSVFLKLPYFKAAEWSKLLTKAGCHRFTSPGFLVRRNSKLLMVFSGKGGLVPPESRIMKGQMDQSGVCEVSLERRYASVKDVFTGETVAKDADRFTLRSEDPRVWLLEVE